MAVSKRNRGMRATRHVLALFDTWTNNTYVLFKNRPCVRHLPIGIPGQTVCRFGRRQGRRFNQPILRCLFAYLTRVALSTSSTSTSSSFAMHSSEKSESPSSATVLSLGFAAPRFP